MEACGVCSDCVKWSRKYSKVDAGRNALRQTVAILEKRVDELIQHNSTLNRDVEELRSKADVEREARIKECDTRVALEKEIADLKSELLILQQSRHIGTPDAGRQVTRVSDLENEISKLNKLVDEEKSRADAALKNVQVEKTKAADAREAAKLEKCRAGKEKTRAATEAKRAKEYKIQLDALKNEAAEARSQLTLATSMSEEANSRLQAERKKASEEQRQTHLLKDEAEKFKSLIGAYEKKLSDEKHRGRILSSQLDKERKNSEERQKTIGQLQKKIDTLEASSKNFMMGSKSLGEKGVIAENSTTLVKTGKAKVSRRKKNADSEIGKVLERSQTQTGTMKSVEEKMQGDKLTHTLQGVRRTVETSAQVNRLLAHSHDVSEVVAQPEKIIHVLPRKITCDGHELEHSKEQIKIATTQAKRIVKKFRKSSLKKQMDILKQDFLQFSNTLEFLDRSLSREAKGATVSVEAQHCPCSRRKKQKLLDIKQLQFERERENPLCVLHMPSNIACHYSKQALCPPESGMNIAESASFTETNTKLECPAGSSYKDFNVSSAKNYSGTSFSDCWSMNSQGKFDSSTTSSNPADGSSLQMTGSRLCGDVTELKDSDMPTMVSKTFVKSHSSAMPDGGPVRCKKRKRIMSLLESIQYGLSDSKKIQMQMEENILILHTELQNQINIPAETNSVACNNQYDRFYKSCKKKEISSNQKVTAQCLPNGAHTVDLDNENLELGAITPDLGIEALTIVPANNLLNGVKVCKPTNVASSNENGHNPNECVGQITDGDYVVLFDLDDHDDERRYRLARESMLSPSLPEIKFLRGSVCSVDGADHAIKDSSNAGISGPDCIPHVNHDDDSPNLKEHSAGTTSKPLQRDATDCFSVKDIEHGAHDVKVEKSNLKVLVNKETRSPCETLFSDDFASLCLVHSETIDRDNLYKVFNATRKAASQCHLSSPPGLLLKRVLDYIKSCDIPPKEKACVFLSMMLGGSHGAVATAMNHPIKESDLIPNSYMADILSAINDVNIRDCLAQTFSLHELLNVIAEFLMEGKLWVCRTPDRNNSESDGSSVSVPVDNRMLFLEAASTDQLFVASTILASLAVSFDEIDFIILLSYNLFRLRKYNYTAALSVIHVAGRKFLTSTSNSLLADVVNSLISLLKSSQSPCSNRPFSEEAVSLDIVINLLLKRLQTLTKMAKKIIVHDDSPEEISDHGASDVESSSSLEEIFTQFTDVLSLLELIANIVGWDSLSSKVVPQLLTELESSAVNIFSIAIITFLGHFGRLGVSANGSEDTCAATIRCRLTAILGVASTENLTFPVQVASVWSLLKFVPLDPNSLLCRESETQTPIDEASPAFQIWRWFTSLSKEHQTVVMGILNEAPQM